MNEVDILSQKDACVLLMNAMCDQIPDRADITEVFKMTEPMNLVQVQVIVNGVPVDFWDSIGRCVEAMLGKMDALVLEKAQELVGEAGLGKLANALSRAEWEIESLLRQAQERNVK